METNKPNQYQTIIPAPAGTKGIFETYLADGSSALYLDAVVALGIYHKTDQLEEGRLLDAPIGIAVDGAMAVAVIAADGRTHDSCGRHPNAQDWLATKGKNRPLVDEFTEQPVQL